MSMSVASLPLEHLLHSPFWQDLEAQIADQVRSTLYRENLPLLLQWLEGEITTSGLPFNEIRTFIEAHPAEVIRFSVAVLRQSPPGQPSIGISVTYAIYLIYLKTKSEEELLSYIVKRRIPEPKKVLKKLQNINKMISSAGH